MHIELLSVVVLFVWEFQVPSHSSHFTFRRKWNFLFYFRLQFTQLKKLSESVINFIDVGHLCSNNICPTNPNHPRSSEWWMLCWCVQDHLCQLV